MTDNKAPVRDEHSVEDFDAFWQSQDRKGKPVKLFGKVYHLPASVPLEFELMARRKAHSSDQDDIERMLALLFGEGVLDEWSAQGMDAEQLGVLLLWSIYNLHGRDTTLAEARDEYNRRDEAKVADPKGKPKSVKRTTGGGSSSRGGR